MTQVITIAAGKGGVGKTATTVNLAASMGLDNKKVLVIDTDVQANSTMFLTGQRLADNAFKGKGLYELARAYGILPTDQFIHKSQIDNIDVIVSNINTPYLEEQIKIVARDNDFEPAEFLFNVLSEIFKTKEYDYVLIDTPPAQNSLTVQTAMVASSDIIIPLKLEEQGVESLLVTDGLRKALEKKYDIQINLLGVLPTIVEKTALTDYYLEIAFNSDDEEENPEKERLCKPYKDKIFKNHIRKGNIVNESSIERIPCVLMNQKKNPSKDYLSLWQEIKQRLEKEK